MDNTDETRAWDALIQKWRAEIDSARAFLKTLEPIGLNADAEPFVPAFGNVNAIDLECLVPRNLRLTVAEMAAADQARRAVTPAAMPSLAEWETMPADEQVLWSCQSCRGPALAGSYDIGHICSFGCAVALRG